MVTLICVNVIIIIIIIIIAVIYCYYCSDDNISHFLYFLCVFLFLSHGPFANVLWAVKVTTQINKN
jgi:hypothetical protein